MAQFDPRRQPMRIAPHALTAVAAISVALLAGRVYQPARAEEAPPLTAVQIAALEARAFAAAGMPAGLTAPEAIPVQVRRGETFEQAVRRTGIAPEEASAVAATLSNAMDVTSIPAGQRFETAIARPRGGRGDARLIGLTMRTGPASQVTVSRTFDGALRLRALEEKVTHETVVLTGKVEGSLSRTARREGAPASVARAAGRLFSHKFDLQRDIKADDEFTYVFGRTVTESGRTIATDDLLYAELKGVSFYRFQRPGSDKVEYFDETGKNTRSAFMRTPLERFSRISSTFGYRRHPIAGFRRMHQGIDFAAPSGTPVIAPADGVVVEARRWGGYGNWLRIRHSNGLESGYGHLSRYASGIRAGQRVRQGQVVAYVGTTGASTGPHLHYEIWRHGQRVNPAGIRTEEGSVLSGAELAAFRAEKARIDRIIAAGGERRVQHAAMTGGLRPAQTS
jgi:murein DD-endopeptidase MepM/ murein hydrolase activator NlpD